MLAIAFVDGRAVPANMTLQQIQALFPQGVSGLRSVVDGEYVFPGENGSIHLEPQKHFTVVPIAHSGASSASNMASPKTAAGRPRSSVQATHESPEASPSGPGQRRQGMAQVLGNEVAAHHQHHSQHPSWPVTPLEGAQGGGYASFEADGDDDLPPQREPSALTRSFEPRQGKLILDRVHEHLMLPLFVFDIIDTPEFQRLRSLKQLGMTSYLYPGATHTRFEHSIGVAHLAGLMVKKIARRQPELNISDEDILCVTVAGLCHDIGHGPFSHLFEEIVNRARAQTRAGPWHHEVMSIRLMHRILARLPIHRYNLTSADANFIALCISGLKQGAPWPANVGRPKEKRFLVEIVSNKRSGIDVDKLDYFMRDSLCCYGRAAVDCHVPRLLAACKVLCFENEYQICYEEKLALSLGDIFTLRAKLHKYAYQHRIVKVLDHMIADLLAAADPYFFVRGKDGRPTRIAECVDDDDAFTQLGDWIFDAMAAASDPAMATAQAIIARIKCRDLYSVVGTAMFARHQHRTTTHRVKEELLQYIEDEDLIRKMDATMIIDFVKITYGSSDSEGNPDDPINNVTFYNPKSSTHHAFRLPKARQSPLFSPSEFGEKSIIVMVRDRQYANIAGVAFSKWRESQTRNLSVAVPVYNLTPGGHGGSSKRRRGADEPIAAKEYGNPIALNLGGKDNNSQQQGDE